MRSGIHLITGLTQETINSHIISLAETELTSKNSVAMMLSRKESDQLKHHFDYGSRNFLYTIDTPSNLLLTLEGVLRVDPDLIIFNDWTELRFYDQRVSLLETIHYLSTLCPVVLGINENDPEAKIIETLNRKKH